MLWWRPRWHKKRWHEGIGWLCILLSVVSACLSLVHHDLCPDRQHACHTHGCWGLLHAPHSLKEPTLSWLLQWRQGRLQLEHPRGVFHPPRSLLLRLALYETYVLTAF